MDKPILTIELLENIARPAFLAKDGTITHVNKEAARQGFLPGSAVLPLILIGEEEYARFQGGRLCLTISNNGIRYQTVIFREDGEELFSLEPELCDREQRTLALIAQQLREPLSNALLTTNALLPEEQLQDLPDIQNQLAKINLNLHRLHRAICNMSDAGQLSVPRPSRTSHRNVSAIVHEILEKASAYLEQAGCSLAYESPEKPVTTAVDEEKLERAILNLISNAAKFSKTGSTIRARLQRNGNKLYFSVSTRAANSEQPLGNLFSQYLRSPSLDSPDNGIGLGLTIVREAAAAHDGTLLVDHAEDGVIRFTMSLAVVPHTDGALRAPILRPGDYSGGYDHALLELSDILPFELYK